MQLPAINGNTKLTGLLGYPVAHSLSPRLQHYWLAKYKINARYLAFEVAPSQLGAAIKGAQALGIIGLNITIPHKEKLHTYVQNFDDAAQKIGAINCLTFSPDGQINASNTDAYGFIENLQQNAANLNLGQVVILGAGGAVRAMIFALQQAGAGHIILVNRTIETAEKLCAEFGGNLSFARWAELPQILPQTTLLVNATSLGMVGHAPLQLDLQPLPRTSLVHDIVYNPRETALLKAARLQGNPTLGGLGMLLYQAQKSFAIWHGITPQITPELIQHLS